MGNLDHQLRVARLLRGERNVTDLDRLFADLRFASPGRTTVTEIGDFAAHRDERDKGVVMKRAGDMQTSARIWVRQLLGIAPTVEEVRVAGYANLNIATDAQISDRLGVTRQIARSQFVQGMNKLAQGGRVSRKQRSAINYFGTCFIWLNAFDDVALVNDLANVLIETGALEHDDRTRFLACGPFVALHALTLMHRARLQLPDGQYAPLRVAIREETGTLRVKAEIPVENIGKPIGCYVSVFETGLEAAAHFSAKLLAHPDLLAGPLEVDCDCRLAAIS